VFFCQLGWLIGGHHVCHHAGMKKGK